MEKNEILKLTEKVFQYVLSLEDETIKGILEERILLKVEIEDTKKEVVEEIEEAIEEISREIKKDKKQECCKEREKWLEEKSKGEILDILEDKNLKKDDLRKIAKENNIYIKSKDTKTQIISKIIEGIK